MRRGILALLCCCAAVVAMAQSTPQKPDAAPTAVQDERDGSSYAKAILIVASNDTAGAAQESEWIRERFPGYRMGKQSTSFYRDKAYDIVSFTDAHGVKHRVYFDISSFYGRKP
jgi:hypothetical protein